MRRIVYEPCNDFEQDYLDKKAFTSFLITTVLGMATYKLIAPY